MFKRAIDMIYPRCCPICSDIVVPKGLKVCPQCKDKLSKIKEPRCKKCSKPIENEEKEYCYDCITKNLHYIKGYAIWVYDKVMKKSISDYKYHNKKEYADFYIEEILAEYEAEIMKIQPDALIPIPIHKSKLKLRGFNQAELLAKGISNALDIPLYTKTLIRNKKTMPQKGLNDKERLKNLKEAFIFSEEEMIKCKKSRKDINKIILIDDIYTTGSTIEACTSILLDEGIKDVYFICICIGKGF